MSKSSSNRIPRPPDHRFGPPHSILPPRFSHGMRNLVDIRPPLSCLQFHTHLARDHGHGTPPFWTASRRCFFFIYLLDRRYFGSYDGTPLHI